MAFAPVENPRYAAARVIEHGGFGAQAAAPLVRDTLTLPVRPAEGDGRACRRFEQSIGGSLAERDARKTAAWRSANGLPPLPTVQRHDHLGHHPAAARAAAVAADLPGRGDLRLRPDRPLFGGGRLGLAVGAEAGASSSSSSWRSPIGMSWMQRNFIKR